MKAGNKSHQTLKAVKSTQEADSRKTQSHDKTTRIVQKMNKFEVETGQLGLKHKQSTGCVLKEEEG